ncbi:hypothetical protein NHE_0667 [Neorickettsia helminthoeca str. Oregon]|uniref:Uncharacterized protein n=1 Tax=Neorickettsia helminthoeca str. Oregon TaxID=1286528 RepID=X5HMB9_9RICK|nr:hypothetical protein NHE_0667 [Neorickettsia helminthoeca str. Oregon]
MIGTLLCVGLSFSILCRNVVSDVAIPIELSTTIATSHELDLLSSETDVAVVS